jgi:hypothetical protein
MRKGRPKTTQGKAIVAYNAIRHGVCAAAPVIPGVERPRDWETHRAGIRASLQPVGSLETEFAERVALLLWRLRRIARFETAAILGGDARRQEFEGDLAAIPTYGYHIRARVTPEEAQTTVEQLRGCVQALEALATLPADTPLKAVDLRACPDTRGMRWLRARQASSPCTIGAIRATLARNRPGDRLEDSLQSARRDLAAAEEQVPQAVARAERVSNEQLLPAHGELDRVIRYEAHLSRQLLATMHELEALQARREGQPTPLARLAVSGPADR